MSEGMGGLLDDISSLGLLAGDGGSKLPSWLPNVSMPQCNFSDRCEFAIFSEWRTLPALTGHPVTSHHDIVACFLE